MKGSCCVQTIFQSRAAVTISLLRAVLGWIFIKEGAGKLFGWLGGSGPESLAHYFQQLGIPFAEANVYLVGYTEFLGGIALLLGFLTRPAALLLGIIMVVAILTAHRQGGYEYPLTILFVCIVLLHIGAGKLSLDYLIAKKQKGADKNR